MAIIQVKVPKLITDKYPYTGYRIYPKIVNADAKYMTASGDTGGYTEARIYTRVYSLNGESYEWIDENGNTLLGNVTISWEVTKSSFEVPTLSDEHIKFNGVQQSVTDIGFNRNVMTRTDVNMKGTKAGEYTVTYSLRDKDSAYWITEKGETTDDQKVKWYIDKIKVAIPMASKTVYETKPLYSNAVYNNVRRYYCSSSRICLEFDNNEGYNFENFETVGSSYIISTKGATQSFAGDYTATFSLKDIDSSVWEDETITPKTIDWKIVKKVEKCTLPYLEPVALIYNKSSQSPYLKNNDTPTNLMRYAYTAFGVTVNDAGKVNGETEVGKYSLVVGLRDYVLTPNNPPNYIQNKDLVDFQWEDGTTDPITLEWEITKRKLIKPTISSLNFEYDGKSHSVTVKDFNGTYMSYSEDTVKNATAAGTYKVSIALEDTEQTEWEDGSTDDVTYQWRIGEFNKVTIPTVTDTEFTYSGSRHSPSISNPDSSMITTDGITYSTDAGNFEIIFKLKDVNSSMWEDGTTEDKRFPWTVNKLKKSFPAPVIRQGYEEFDYDGKWKITHIDGFDTDGMVLKSDLGKIEAGTHTVLIGLSDNKNYELSWEDGSVEDIELAWVINPIVVPLPAVEPTLLYYKNSYVHPKVNGYNPNIMSSDINTWVGSYSPKADQFGKQYSISNYVWDYASTQKKNVGKYYINFTFKHPNSCTWEGIAGDKLTLEWVIQREIKLLEKPYLLVDSFEYNGEEKTPDIVNNLTGIVFSGDLSGTGQGDYNIQATLYREFKTTDLYDYRWADGSAEDTVIDLHWKITGSGISVPKVTNTNITYDGLPHLPDISGYGPNTMTLEAEEQAEAGDYIVTIKLKDSNSSKWADGTNADKIFDWHILPIVILKPYITPEYMTYDGESHTVEFEENEKEHSFIVNNYNPDIMTYMGDIKKTDVGDYNVKVSIKHPSSCSWGDNTSSVDLPWKIVKKVVLYDKPFLEGNEYPYNGNSYTPEIVTLKEGMEADGDLSGKDPGAYSITVSLKEDRNITYLWGDKTNVPVTLKWSIIGEGETPEMRVAKIPYLTDTVFTYDGNEYSPTKNNWEDDELFNVSGKLSAVHADEYVVKLTLKNKNSIVWEDGTSEAKTLTWKIEKKSVDKPTIYNTEFDYNGEIQAPTIKGFDEDSMSFGKNSVLKATDAGNYSIAVSFKNNNYKWSDGDENRSVSFPWSIRESIADKPYINPNTFEYTGGVITPVINGFEPDYMSIDAANSKNSALVVGDYKITVRLGGNYQFADETKECVLDWHIVTEGVVAIPDVTDTVFVYDSTKHAPIISDYDVNVISLSGNTSATNAGDYSIIFKLKDKEHFRWENGTVDDIKVPWCIASEIVKKPTVSNTHFVYNGGAHAPTISGFDEALMVCGGKTETIHAGNYTVIVSLKNGNYRWEDGSKEPLEFDWDIARKTVSSVYLKPASYSYNGERRQPNIVNYNPSVMKIAEDSKISGIDARDYIIVISLMQPAYDDGSVRYYCDYQWEDGTTDNVVLKWHITRSGLKYPVLLKKSYVYNGNFQLPEMDGFIPEVMKANGDYGAVNAGKYEVSFELVKTRNYYWEEGVWDNCLTYEWEITSATLRKSDFVIIQKQDPPLIYNQTFQNAVFDGADKNKLTNIGDSKGRDAGSYTAQFVPNRNYTWEDGTRTPIEVPWVIEKCGIKTPEQTRRIIYHAGIEQYPHWDYNPAFVTIEITGQTKGTYAGTYYVDCVCDDNCYFSDTGTNQCVATWGISKQVLSKPLPYKEYEYTGELIQPRIINYFSGIMNATGTLEAVDIGDYIAYFELLDTDNFVWGRDVKVVDGKVATTWRIIRSYNYVNIPRQSNAPMYDGTKKSPTWFDYNPNAMILLGGTPSEINAGTYYVTFRLRKGYVWRDGTYKGTSKDQIIPWQIYKRKIYRPYISGTDEEGEGAYYYEIEGKRYPIWERYEPDVMTMGGDTCDVDGSWHNTYFDFVDPENYEWDNGVSERYNVSWKLVRPYIPPVSSSGVRRAHIPQQVRPPYEDGKVKYPEWDSFNNTAIIKVGGEWDGIKAGEYNVILALEDGYVWEDGTTEIKIVPWVILGDNDDIGYKLIPIHIPEQINPPTYDGYVKEPEWDTWDKWGFDIVKGELYGVPAGVYYVTLRPQTGYVWDDGTFEDKVIPWVINKIDEEPVVPPENPREPEPEEEGETEDVGTGGNCCCSPCCDTGLFDKLNNYEFDDGFTCDCSNGEN